MDLHYNIGKILGIDNSGQCSLEGLQTFLYKR